MAAGRRGKVLMLKKSLIFIIILLVLSSTSYGKTDEEKYLPGLQKEYTAKGVVWLSIDSSAPGQQGNLPPQGLNQFMNDRSGSPTAIFEDTDGRIGHLYGAQTTPHMFVIDPKGILIYQGAIDDIPSPDIDDLKTAKNYVSAALDAAMNGKPVVVSSTKSYGCSVKY